jgi:hypothetical protein
MLLQKSQEKDKQRVEEFTHQFHDDMNVAERLQAKEHSNIHARTDVVNVEKSAVVLSANTVGP